MQWTLWRQAALLGLVIFILGTGVRVAWLAGAPARHVTQELGELSDGLKGLVIVVDPGHGGDDPGAVVNGTREKVITLQISLALKELLERHGAKVILTRSEDVDLGGPIREELGKRVALVAEHGGQLFVSIHANKDRCNCWGAQTFYQKDGMSEGKALAEVIQARLRSMTPTTRQALAANYFVLRTTSVPAAVVEVGFLTNAKEHARLLEPAYQNTVASAVALGIADYQRGPFRVTPARPPEEQPDEAPQPPKKRKWWLPPWW